MGRQPPHERRLGPLSRDILAVLIDATEPGEGLPRTRAVAVIEAANAADDDRLWRHEDDVTDEIEDALDSLLNRGFLYAVDDQVYVTDRDLIE